MLISRPILYNHSEICKFVAHALGGGKVAMKPKSRNSDMAIIIRDLQGKANPWYYPKNVLIGLDFEKNDYRIVENI